MGEIKVVCQNEKCRFYLKEEGKDVVKRGKYQTGHQRYFCQHCKTFFMETKGTLFYRKHLSKSEIFEICRLLAGKNGIREIERVTGHHRDTIGKLIEDLALNAEMVNSMLGQSEIAKIWPFIKEVKRKLSPEAQKVLKSIINPDTGC